MRLYCTTHENVFASGQLHLCAAIKLISDPLMSPDIPVGGGAWTPPFVHPLLRALDRMQQRREVSAEVLTGRALDLLIERLGPASYPAESTFSHGVLGIAADHSTLVDGFALMLPIRDGIAVSVRESPRPHSRLVFDGDEKKWEFDSRSLQLGLAEEEQVDPMPWWVKVVMMVIRAAGTSERQVDAAVVSTIVAGCEQSYAAALAMATLRTTEAVFPAENATDDPFQLIAQIVSDVTGRLPTNAYAVATDVASLGQFVLVDTKTGRRLPFPTPAAEPAGWGLVDTGEPVHVNERLVKVHASLTDALERLRRKHFPGLDSLRDLEHKDLELAEKTVSRSQRPLLRYVVRENQRVHRLVTAARKGDWQLFGALLVMGHASLRDDMNLTTERTDRIVELVEDRTVSGMYGGRSLGFSGVVIVLGQPFLVPPFLDAAKDELKEHFGIDANTVLL